MIIARVVDCLFRPIWGRWMDGWMDGNKGEGTFFFNFVAHRFFYIYIYIYIYISFFGRLRV